MKLKSLKLFNLTGTDVNSGPGHDDNSNKLNRVLRKLFSGFQRKKNVLLVIELGTTYLKIGVVKRNKRSNELKRFEIYNLPADYIEKSVKIKEIIDNNFLNVASNSALILPRNLISVKNVNLPSSSVKELEAMANFQAQKLSPFPSDNLVNDFCIVSVGDNGYSDIDLFMADKANLMNILNSLSDYSNKVCWVFASSELISHYTIKDNKITDFIGNDAAVVIDLDYENIHILLFDQKRLVFSRAISQDAITVEPNNNRYYNEEWCETINEEIENTISACQKNRELPGIGKAVIMGATNGADELGQYIQAELKIPILIESTADNNVKIENEAADIPYSHDQRFSKSALLGYIAGSGKAQINLLPDEIVRKRQNAAFRKELLKTLALFIFIVILTSSYVNIMLSQEIKRLSVLQDQVQSTAKTANDLESLMRQIRLIEDEVNLESNVLDVISELINLAPPNITLDIFNYSLGKRIIIKGYASSLENVLSYIDKLEKSQILEHINLDNANNIKQDNIQKTRFQLSVSTVRIR